MELEKLLKINDVNGEKTGVVKASKIRRIVRKDYKLKHGHGIIRKWSHIEYGDFERDLNRQCEAAGVKLIILNDE